MLVLSLMLFRFEDAVQYIYAELSTINSKFEWKLKLEAIKIYQVYSVFFLNFEIIHQFVQTALALSKEQRYHILRIRGAYQEGENSVFIHIR